MIVGSGNHYVVQVKRNQKTLFDEIQDTMLSGTPLDYHQAHETGHGRVSSWHVTVYDAGPSHKAREWENLRRFIHVHKVTEKRGREHHSDRFYISDLFRCDARRFHQEIRGHWRIENSLHWVKDVVHNEDKNRIVTDNGPVNSAVFSSIAINIHRKFGSYSITESQVRFNANIKELFAYLRT